MASECSDRLVFVYIPSPWVGPSEIMYYCCSALPKPASSHLYFVGLFLRGFDKIISKEIPANVVYEDEKVLAFRDINPQAPVHILIIPKAKDGLSRLAKAEERHFEILGRLLYTAKVIAKQEGLEDGFRVVINDGPKGCQSVYHIHVHLLGGRQMEWPAG
ncbi:14 kDa zinc-binding protein [Bienertia sinuspersici]